MVDKQIRLLDEVKEAKAKEDAKADMYAKRGKSKSDFYAQARINIETIKCLRTLLKDSFMSDTDGSVTENKWTDEYIDMYIDAEVVDPGPARTRK